MTTSKATRPYTGYGWGWRERRTAPGSRKWVLQKLVSVRVDPYMVSDFDEFIEYLIKLNNEAGLEESTVETEIEYGSFGDRDRDIMKICGWRDATQEEIDEAEEVLRKHQKTREEMQQRQIEQLRREKPELFK